jgi:DNA topoisomerase-2
MSKSATKKKDDTPTIEEQFKKKSLHQHILDLPDSYIGSIQNDTKNLYSYNDDENLITRNDKNIVLGFYKIIDEIIVNAADNTVRDKKCNIIKVNINEKSGEISVYNNGSSIPIELHKDEQIYVPEMIFGNLLTSGNYDQKGKTVGGKNGFGAKCISPETMIPFFNGNIKKASEIKVGNKLIGDDGKVRKVLKVIKGKGQMYEIKQSVGESYKVNDQHILTLHMPDHKVIFWNNSENGWSVLWWNHESMSINKKTIKISHNNITCPICDIELHGNLKRHYTRKHPEEQLPIKERKSPTKNPLIETEENKQAKIKLEEFCNTISDLNIFDIGIQDYIKLDSTTKGRLAGIRGECVQWEKKEVSLDPYLLGLWLGDGSQTGYRYACDGENDYQIIDYLKEWGKNNDATIKYTDKYEYTFTSTNNFRKKGFAPLKKLLKQYNLVNNKHIPIEYLINDRETRLALLAGIIDTDGHVCRKGTRIIISQGFNHEQLAKDILYLSRSLGFVCSFTIKKTSWRHNGELKKGQCYNINISGDIKDIPTKLPRKKCSSERSHSFKSTGAINISKIGIEEYIGIEIDGNNRFLINDFTVTHNCANIYSERFDIELVDSKRNKKYFQRFKNNMYDKDEPVITDVPKNSESYIKITFLPDYKRFGLKELTKDMLSLFKRRVYDIAGTTIPSVKVYYNDKLLEIKSFEDYIKMYYADENINLIYQDFNERWSVGVVFDTNSGYQHMTFVNKISTFEGGTHLNYIVNQIIDKVTTHITDKHKNLKIKPSQIKDNITVFINAVIEDPSFSSQTKESLTTKSSLFNIKCELDDKFIQKICRTGLVEELVQVAQVKQLAELEKSDGKKNSSLKNLPKLDDARLAGSKRSPECRLILTEGDSAKSFAISGLEIIGRDKYGVFPLKGKLLNVREANPKQLLSNEEIKNIKQILGLKQNTHYTDTKKLRYGGVILLTDSDVDGAHIKGLLMNFLHYFWPSLLKIEGFVQSISTPIVKVYKKSDSKKINPEIFYNLTDYNKWSDKVGDSYKNYIIKYYKGLGTSTEKEAKESFVDFESKIINYIWSNNTTKNIILDKNKKEEDNNVEDNEDDNNSKKSSINDNKSNKSNSDIQDQNDKTEESYQALTLAFAKQRANDRKDWLREYNPTLIIENNVKKILYSEFVNKDLIHFSNSDNVRSIPNICDGLKPSQRKILYGSFKRRLDNDEIKVAQLSGYISEHTGYHHGEASLQGAIINMAQDFCGSNNINLLKPNGNFGSRRMGGKDAASPRYIFTQLNELTRQIYINKDESVLEYNIEEGDVVEPVSYYPIIPMILINGSEGIGTGFSTYIPPHNPIEIMNNIKEVLNGKKITDLNDMVPWYKGFIGTIEKVNDTTYNSTGKYKIVNETTIHITELPIGTWTQDYLEFLSQSIEEQKLISDYENNSGNHNIDIKIYFINSELQKLIKSNTLEKRLKLVSIIKTSNMHLYKNNVITKYQNANIILKDYIDIRIEIYTKRKNYNIKILENELSLLKYRKQFIEQIISKDIIIERKKKSEIIDRLVELKYPELSISLENKKNYDYITNLPLFSLTLEKIEEFNKDYNDKLTELTMYKNTTIQQLWINEIDNLEKVYIKWLSNFEESISSNDTKLKSKSKINKSRKTEIDIYEEKVEKLEKKINKK